MSILLPEKLVIATSNPGKLQELRKILPESFTILSLGDLGFDEEIPETGASLEENALLKARFVHERFGGDCMADDSGLEVEDLGYAPGVHSARYAGIPSDPRANNQKLIRELEGKKNRKARFRTVLALIYKNKEHLFEGSLDGTISLSPSGTGGFGYDPLFIPDGYDFTFAEMDPDLKNRISHRARAVEKLRKFLEQ